MSNIFIGWKESDDPPAPWSRLTRQGKYIRLTDSAANHLASVGALTHDHDDTMASFSVSNCATTPGPYWSTSAMRVHGHSNPSSYAISNANNDPAYYCIDLIYMDFATWKTYQRSFPDGSIVFSAAALEESGSFSRFTSADGKLIKNDTPGTTGGSTGTRTHTVTATTASSGTAADQASTGSGIAAQASHAHYISLTSSGSTNEPRVLTTRLYEVLSTILAAKENMVAFCDGTPDDDWEILSSWKDANLKSGNSDPTLSGSDTHNETVSGNTNSSSLSNSRASGGNPDFSGASATHTHPVSGTLKTVSHIPSSIYLMPIRLTVDYYVVISPRAQLIGIW